jgi:hypothetical protein
VSGALGLWAEIQGRHPLGYFFIGAFSAFSVVALASAAIQAISRRRLDYEKLLVRARVIVSLYYQLQQNSQQYQPTSGDTFAQISGRALLARSLEDNFLKRIRHQAWIYKDTTKGLPEQVRSPHEAIVARITKSQSLSELHSPIQDLIKLTLKIE